MYRKLVKYDQWHFAEVDPVRLKRKALLLRDQITKKIRPNDDPYGFYEITLPIIEAAIGGHIVTSLDGDVTEFISSDYMHDRREGTLPVTYDDEFGSAVAGFAVTAEGLSLEQPELEVVNGLTFAWMNCEEESDWPDKMPYP